MMKITGVLVDMLVQLCPEVYGPYVVFENGRNYYMFKCQGQFMECYKQHYYGTRNSK